jgi:hypothetical protein
MAAIISRRRKGKSDVSSHPSSTIYDIFSLGSYAADKRFVLNIMRELTTPGGHVTPADLDLAEKLGFRLLILGVWSKA